MLYPSARVHLYLIEAGIHDGEATLQKCIKLSVEVEFSSYASQCDAMRQ